MSRISFCLFTWLIFSSAVSATPIQKKYSPADTPTHIKRSNTHLIDECLLVGVEEATYIYKSQGLADVCGLYLVGGTDQRIEVSIDYLHVDCDSGGVVTLLDGWEMSGEVFPPFESDEPVENRVTNFCGTVKKRHYITSSNSATIMYRMPTIGDTMRVSVKFGKHPKPCNVLLTTDSEIVTLRNHGLRRNCTLATAYPANIEMLQLSVGIEAKSNKFPHHKQIETGILTRCHKRGYGDMVLIGGAKGLDTSAMRVQELYCGLDSFPKTHPARILCDVSSVQLVSSGLYDNAVTVVVTPLTSLEPLPTLMCEAEI